MHKSVLFFSPTDETLNFARELKLDSVFLSFGSASVENIFLVRSILNDTDIYVEVPAFAGFELLEKYPDSKPVEATGKTTQKDSYCGLCPTHPGLRRECLDKVKKLLELDVNGIWLDFIRYPTKWEEPEPDILDTCYCDRCLKMFSEYLGESVHGNTLEEKVQHIDGSFYVEWLEFKSAQITSMVKDVKNLINESGKPIKLGFFAIPWEDKEYGAAIKRIMGQDFNQLASLVDVISPMLYHKMCGKPVEWVKQKVEYFWQLGIPFIPLIQTESRISDITVDEFKKALEYAGSKPSSGVCIFFVEDMLKDSDKVGAAKSFFG